MVVANKFTVAVAGLASIAAAVPTQPGKYSIEQVARPATKASNFASKYSKVLQKYRVDVPTHVRAAAVASGVATTTPEQQDTEYLTPVKIGDTTLELDFDTGSADLYVILFLPSREMTELTKL